MLVLSLATGRAGTNVLMYSFVSREVLLAVSIPSLVHVIALALDVQQQASTHQILYQDPQGVVAISCTRSTLTVLRVTRSDGNRTSFSASCLKLIPRAACISSAEADQLS